MYEEAIRKQFNMIANALKAGQQSSGGHEPGEEGLATALFCRKLLLHILVAGPSFEKQLVGPLKPPSRSGVRSSLWHESIVLST